MSGRGLVEVELCGWAPMEVGDGDESNGKDPTAPGRLGHRRVWF